MGGGRRLLGGGQLPAAAYPNLRHWVKSVRWKIEKRVLERIGHVVRMGNDRLVKAMVFGWYEGSEGKSKMKGRKRKEQWEEDRFRM